MSSGLGRLRALYGMVEWVRSAEARLADAAVAEVAAVRVEEERRWWASAALEREATSGEERALAEGAMDAQAWRVGRLREMQARRVAVRDDAMAAYVESRVLTGQVERVLARAALLRAVEEGRRAQAVADDRFGARQGWLRGMKDR